MLVDRLCAENSLRRICGLAALALVSSASVASAQGVDTVLFNGKVLTVDADFSVREALAIADGKVFATGTTEAIKKLADGRTRQIDLGGRTVIPGLTDGHIHGVRAALTFGTEINWIGVPSLKEALEKIRQAAAAQPAGSWIVVAGGWTEEQFSEKRGRRRRKSRRPRRKIPSISSISMTGSCCHPGRWRH